MNIRVIKLPIIIGNLLERANTKIDLIISKNINIKMNQFVWKLGLAGICSAGMASALITHHYRCTNKSFNESTFPKTVSRALVPLTGGAYYLSAISGKLRYMVIAETLQTIIMVKYPRDKPMNSSECPIARHFTKT